MEIMKKIRDRHQNELILLFVFLVLLETTMVLIPDKGQRLSIIGTIMEQMPELGFMALAMLVPVLAGGVNLSITTGAAFSAIVAAKFMYIPWGQRHASLAAILGAFLLIGVSAASGLINGYLIGYLGISAMLSTLTTGMIFEGLGLVITEGASVGIRQTQFMDLASGKIGPVPFSMIFYILAVLAATYLLERSSWGTQVYQSGNNKEAAVLSGIDTAKTILLVYVFSGVMYGFSGMLISARYCSAKTDYGASYLLMALAAVVMGGTGFHGERGTVGSTFLAVLILKFLSGGLGSVYHWDKNVVSIVTGCILIFVLILQYDNRRDAAPRKRRKRKKA